MLAANLQNLARECDPLLHQARLGFVQTHTEIAKELEQPLGTIKSRIAMGLRKLAAALAPPQ